MLIEFICPICTASLSVDEKAAGGQVNCPKCSKSILIPFKSPLERIDGKEPFDASIMRGAKEVSRAISSSVEPYLREMENKNKLLNDAVEMVKALNKKIKEVETLLLAVQRDLWAVEVDFDERQAEIDRLGTQREALIKDIAKQAEKAKREKADAKKSDEENKGPSETQRLREELGDKLADVEKTLAVETNKREEYEARMAELEGQEEGLRAELESARSELTHAKAVSDVFRKDADQLREVLVRRNEQISEAFKQLTVLQTMQSATVRVSEALDTQQQTLASGEETLAEAGNLLSVATERLEMAGAKIRQLENTANSLRTERDSLKDQVDTQTQTSEERGGLLANLQQKLDDQNAKFADALSKEAARTKTEAELQARFTELEQQALQREEKLQAFSSGDRGRQELIANLEAEKELLEGKLKVSEEELASTRKQLDVQQRALEQVKQDLSEAEEAEDETVMRLQGMQEALSGQREEFSAQLQQAAQQAALVTSLEQKLSEATQSLLDRESELNEGRKQFEALESKVWTLEQQNSALKEQIEEEAALRSRTRETLDALEARIRPVAPAADGAGGGEGEGNIREMLAATRQRLDEQSNQLQASLSETASQTERLAELRTMFGQLQKELVEKEQAVQENQVLKQTQKKAIIQLEKDKGRVEQALGEKDTELAKLVGKISAVEDSLKETRKAFEKDTTRYEEERAEWTRSMDEARAKEEKAMEMVTRFEKEIDRMHRQAAKTEDVLEDVAVTKSDEEVESFLKAAETGLIEVNPLEIDAVIAERERAENGE